ncbi:MULTISPECIES: hypothetical protein [unclassified Streptomyces]|uniref:hypothetical protein n=1 Tax=unclassified Streptomyces TaxID=2593676 RepID=UPI000966B9C3|nr:hypothetical protein [Streptomyces sp. CB02400]OKJ93414.1 hypothetical protein AMK33_33505 [Streptomyces sp. CB02400]
MTRGARLAAHGAVSTSPALCGDRQLRELVEAATPIGSGIGSPRTVGSHLYRSFPRLGITARSRLRYLIDGSLVTAGHRK